MMPDLIFEKNLCYFKTIVLQQKYVFNVKCILRTKKGDLVKQNIFRCNKPSVYFLHQQLNNMNHF